MQLLQVPGESRRLHVVPFAIMTDFQAFVRFEPILQANECLLRDAVVPEHLSDPQLKSPLRRVGVHRRAPTCLELLEGKVSLRIHRSHRSVSLMSLPLAMCTASSTV